MMKDTVALLDRCWFLTNQVDYCLGGISATIISTHYRGILRPVTTVIGGGILRYWPGAGDPTPEKLKNCYALLGCFVGIEAKPRFLLIVTPYEDLHTYLLKDNPMNELSVKKGKVSDGLFEGGSMELSVRLWKV